MDVRDLTIEDVELPPWQSIDEVLGGAGVEEVPLPDGMGFGGADVWTGLSKDGTLYGVLCVERTGLKFGTYAFRRHPDSRREWISLQEFTEGRVTVSPERGVQILTWLSPNSRAVRRAQLPGYVSPEAAGVATPIQIVPTAPAAGGSTGGADPEALRLATQTRKDLQRVAAEQAARIAALEERLARLERTPPQIDVNQIRDVIWNLDVVIDRVYASLKEDNPGLVEQIQRIARDASAPPAPE